MDNKEKVIVYIDGFNLYFGIKSKFPHAKWLNMWAFAKSLLKPEQELVEVKYFTSRVSNNPNKEKRQGDYLSVLKSTPLKIFYGQYKSKPITCKSCGHSWANNEGKMTDVNIAVHMITDAMQDRYDSALLVSGDSDLVPPIKTIHDYFAPKRVIVAFPPDRFNNSVKNVAKGSFIIGKPKLMQNQFPLVVTLASGYEITKPTDW
ncbi:MAG: NYN domain-containing protein [Vampirovibrionia bacterium]